ncbi:MAG: N-acetylneuraminate synthase family protein [Spirochaetes bacterium]|nr:N-acetylneuraminate synthase family protein [Spirochaetota bacterium]
MNMDLYNARYLNKLQKGQPVFIAEIGLNHNGRLEEAIDLVKKAAEAGADLVKFQIFNAEKFYSVYANSLINNEEPHYDDWAMHFFKKFELSFDDYKTLQQVAFDNGVVFFASCFDDDSFDMMECLEVPLYKIASSEITNVPLLKKIASTHKPVIVSTGISFQYEIAHAVHLFQKEKCHIVLLHCVSLYPVPHSVVNISRIHTLQQLFNVPVGFSDHSNDNRASIMAVALGARVFEKHFKLSSDHDCVDKNVSLTPEEFKDYVADITEACEMMGDGSVDYSNDEAMVARSARRSIFAARDIPAGTKIQYSDIIVKRPGVGLSPLYIEDIVGKKVMRTITKDMPVLKDDVE